MTEGAKYHKLTKADDGYIDLQVHTFPLVIIIWFLIVSVFFVHMSIHTFI